MIHELIRQCRSFRRFYEETSIDREILKVFVDCARLSSSSANLQPLKYIISNDPQKNGLIFPCLSWAGYLKDWSGPPEGERPSAYIIILGDKDISKNINCDQGIAAQSIRLCASEKGFGGCIIGLINKRKLAEAAGIPDQYEILLVIALGKPKETVVIEKLGRQNNIRYWRDKEETHHVPKRSLDSIIIE